jgi:hypothetical protein
MPNGSSGTRKLRPGAATMMASLGSRVSRPPVVSSRNFFENTHTARPTINLTQGVRPPVVPMSNMFPGPKAPSPFNMSPKNLSGTGGKRTRKQKRNRRKYKN